MKSHSAWRMVLARQIAPAYTANPKVEAVFVFGSVARGWADQYSDIEIGVVWSEAPTEDDFQEASARAGASDYAPCLYVEAKQSWAEQFRVAGVRIEPVHWTHKTVESIIADVMERYDVSQNFLIFEKQAFVSTVQNSEVLYGHALMGSWRQQVENYPEALAVAMVEKHLNFGALGSREMLAERNEIPLLYENNSQSTRRLLNLLFGLNRIYHPTFKWTHYLTEEMRLAPPELFSRLEKVYQSDPITGTQKLRSLIEEAFDLVEKHLPQVDVQTRRGEFRKSCEFWTQFPGD